jgi:hypothetical protein
LLTISFSYSQGNEAWVENLEHKFHKEFKAAPNIQWVTAGEGRVAGEVRSAGGSGFGAGNVTFVNVYEAGFVFLWVRVSLLADRTPPYRHMVPHDQPEAALVSSSSLSERINLELLTHLTERTCSRGGYLTYP